jgi:hypothetical protein
MTLKMAVLAPMPRGGDLLLREYVEVCLHLVAKRAVHAIAPGEIAQQTGDA